MHTFFCGTICVIYILVRIGLKSRKSTILIDIYFNIIYQVVHYWSIMVVRVLNLHRSRPGRDSCTMNIN